MHNPKSLVNLDARIKKQTATVVTNPSRRYWGKIDIFDIVIYVRLTCNYIYTIRKYQTFWNVCVKAVYKLLHINLFDLCYTDTLINNSK